MIACLGMTNPMYEYLLIPLLLFAIGLLVGQRIERLLSDDIRCPCCLSWERLPHDEVEQSHIKILGPERSAPYDWAKENAND